MGQVACRGYLPVQLNHPHPPHAHAPSPLYILPTPPGPAPFPPFPPARSPLVDGVVLDAAAEVRAQRAVGMQHARLVAVQRLLAQPVLGHLVPQEEEGGEAGAAAGGGGGAGGGNSVAFRQEAPLPATIMRHMATATLQP